MSGNDAGARQFRFDPETYDALMASDVPAYGRLQAAVAQACGDGDVVTPIDGVVDAPSSLAEQLGWLADAGLTASAPWVERDLAVMVGAKV